MQLRHERFPRPPLYVFAECARKRLVPGRHENAYFYAKNKNKKFQNNYQNIQFIY